ncbi:MAG: CpaF family protein, partial [Anderseniella sp.]
MFGKRGDTPQQPPVQQGLPAGPAPTAPAAPPAVTQAQLIPGLDIGTNAVPVSTPASNPAAAEVGNTNMPARQAQPKPARQSRTGRSDSYYDIKTSIFNALIDAIDLTQLGQLDRDAARDEIRDIVNEIISLKDVAMSIAEQEELLEDICNDVLGYGPLEPLLAR